MRLLARREHAERELRTKLGARGFDLSEIDKAIGVLQAKGWQSDERFARSSIIARSQRGQGPKKIASHLQQQGIDPTLIQSEAIDWVDQATLVLRKHLRGKDVSDFNVRMKAMRHAVQKGFTPEQAKKALAHYQQEKDE